MIVDPINIISLYIGYCIGAFITAAIIKFIWGKGAFQRDHSGPFSDPCSIGHAACFIWPITLVCLTPYFSIKIAQLVIPSNEEFNTERQRKRSEDEKKKAILNGPPLDSLEEEFSRDLFNPESVLMKDSLWERLR